MRNGTPMLSGWGRVPLPGKEEFSDDLLRSSEDAILSRGLGRSYGDSALPPRSHPRVLNTTMADRLLSFDPATGRLLVEAGVSLVTLNRVFLPRGWFVPVTPGTQFVTVGGMVAADVHGKGHHRAGTFGEHVTRLRMRVADGRVLWCSDTEHQDLFRATIGGMGLTGHILEIEFVMRRIACPWIASETQRVDNIDAYVIGLQEAAQRFPYTMGWIDCLSGGAKMGRGILMAGDWADPAQAPHRFPKPKQRITFPFEMPTFALNRFTVQAFNTVYFWRHIPRKQQYITHWETFFYPLDTIRHWNRGYGRRGFTQYQCVIPRSAGVEAVRRVLTTLTDRGGASFLCVIKDCGPEGKGVLSFPTSGTSIALDIPVRDDTQALVDALNEQVIKEGGRIYLAKDTFTLPHHFHQMEPRLQEFEAIRNKWDPKRRFRSAQSVRLFGDPA